MPIAASVSSETMPAARTCFCTSVRCNQQASIRTTSGRANGLVSMLKALVKERPGPAMFGGRAEGEGENDNESVTDPCRDHLLFGICPRSDRGAQGWQGSETSQAAGINGLQARGNGQG